MSAEFCNKSEFVVNCHEQLLEDSSWSVGKFLRHVLKTSEVLTALDVTPCSLVVRYKHFERRCCLRFQGRDIATYLPNCTQLHTVFFA